MPCPLTQTWDAAIAVRDAVYRVLGFKVFIIPVLLLPDTLRDPLLDEWAGQRRVKVLFGADDLVNRLLALADRTEIKHPPTAGHIRNEVEAVTKGLVTPARPPGPAETTLWRGLAVISNVPWALCSPGHRARTIMRASSQPPTGTPMYGWTCPEPR